MKITKYDVYASYDDAIKLYRRALKKGYSYGEINQLTPEDEKNVKIISQGKRVTQVIERKSFRAFSKEFNCEVIIPEKCKTVEVGPISKYVQKRASKTDLPVVLLYRNYSSKKLMESDFELVKLTLVREY